MRHVIRKNKPPNACRTMELNSLSCLSLHLFPRGHFLLGAAACSRRLALQGCGRHPDEKGLDRQREKERERESVSSLLFFRSLCEFVFGLDAFLEILLTLFSSRLPCSLASFSRASTRPFVSRQRSLHQRRWTTARSLCSPSRRGPPRPSAGPR